MKILKETEKAGLQWNKVEEDKEVMELKDGKGKVKKIFYIINGYKNIKFGWEKKKITGGMKKCFEMEISWGNTGEEMEYLKELMTVMVLGIDIGRYIKNDNEIKAVMGFMEELMFWK